VYACTVYSVHVRTVLMTWTVWFRFMIGFPLLSLFGYNGSENGSIDRIGGLTNPHLQTYITIPEPAS
jgi:hypothetical protein